MLVDDGREHGGERRGEEVEGEELMDAGSTSAAPSSGASKRWNAGQQTRD